MEVSLRKGPENLQVQSCNGTLCGELNARYSAIFQALQREKSLVLQFLLVPPRSPDNGSEKRKQSRKAGMTTRALSLVLLVNIYGPMDLHDLVGDYLSHCSEYLQPPRLCDRNVPYRNPQSLCGKDANPPMTFQFREHSPLSEIDLTDRDIDPSAVLETQVSLPESNVPVAVRTVLYRQVRI